MDEKEEKQILTEESEKTADTQVQEDSSQQEENSLSEGEKRAKFYEACYRLSEAKSISELLSIERMFLQLEGYQDCDKRLEQCRAKIVELQEQKAVQDAANAQRLEKLREEYTQLRDEAKRCEKILRKREAARKLTEISEKLAQDYSEIEGAEDYAREFSAKAAQLEKEYERRQAFEKKSCAIVALAEIAAAALYLLLFANIGDKFSPLVPLVICDCILFSGFTIGYFCESSSGAYASLFAALDFALALIGTIVLCILNKLALGFGGYVMLLLLPIVIGGAVGAIVYIVWSRFAAKSEKDQIKRGRKG